MKDYMEKVSLKAIVSDTPTKESKMWRLTAVFLAVVDGGILRKEIGMENGRIGMEESERKRKGIKESDSLTKIQTQEAKD